MSVVNILDLVKLVRLRLVELVHQICEILHLSPRKFSSKLHYKSIKGRTLHIIDEMKHEPVFGLPVAHLAAHACKRKEFVPSLIDFFFMFIPGQLSQEFTESMQ